MRTPAGKECRHYYEDFHRGRNVQECRLVQANPQSERWHPADCARCPVPAILLANADPDMELNLTIRNRFLGLRRSYEIEAHSRSDGSVIADPYVGRIKENRGLDIFRQALEEDDDD